MSVLHLLAFGTLLALILVGIKGPPVEREGLNRVVIQDVDIEQVRAKWIRTWSRPPTAMELRNALREHVRQEVLYREALARGLDREDPTVRLTMVRKLTMIGSAQVETREVSDDEIEAYYALRRERYRVPATVSLMHVYLSKDKREETARSDAEQFLAKLRERDPRPEELAAFGDPLMLPSTYADMSEQELNRTFGGAFGTAVLALQPGQWQGPIESGYGLHLVKAYDREESRLPDWTEVRQRVLDDLRYEARKAAEDEFYQEVAARYQVVYDQAASGVLEEKEE